MDGYAIAAGGRVTLTRLSLSPFFFLLETCLLGCVWLVLVLVGFEGKGKEW